jgi:hypothetical protein
MRTTVDLDPHLLKRLRAEAHRRGIPFKELLTTILQRGLEDRPAGSRARYRCPTYAMGEPLASLNLDKALNIAAALEDQEIVRKLRLRK